MLNKALKAIFLLIFLIGCAKPTDPAKGGGGESDFNPDDLLEVFIQPATIGSNVSATDPSLVDGSPAVLDFGTISASGGKIKGLRITNKTTTSKTITVQGINPPFSIFLNKCGSISPNQSCSLYIKIDSSYFTLDGPISPVQITLNYGSNSSDNLPILLKATITNGINSSSGWTIQGEMTTGFESNFTLGINPGTRVFYFYNPSSVAAPISTINLTITPYYKIATNNCTGYLLPKQRCSIVLLYENFMNQSPANYHGVLRYNKNSAGDRQGFDTYIKTTTPTPETYIATFSNYPASPVPNACNGTQSTTRTITLCKQQSDNTVVSNSLCSDPIPNKTYKSPAGLGNPTSIPHGTRYESCNEGQTSGTYSYQCDATYQLQGTDCISLITYQESSFMELTVGAKRVINNGYIFQSFIGNSIETPRSNNGYIIWSSEVK